jgi:hypothetical protein
VLATRKKRGTGTAAKKTVAKKTTKWGTDGYIKNIPVYRLSLI